jgi:hypothetical protein
VIPHIPGVRRRESEKAFDHLPLGRRPAPHGAGYDDFFGRRLRRRSAWARMKV